MTSPFLLLLNQMQKMDLDSVPNQATSNLGLQILFSVWARDRSHLKNMAGNWRWWLWYTVQICWENKRRRNPSIKIRSDNYYNINCLVIKQCFHQVAVPNSEFIFVLRPHFWDHQTNCGGGGDNVQTPSDTGHEFWCSYSSKWAFVRKNSENM